MIYWLKSVLWVYCVNWSFIIHLLLWSAAEFLLMYYWNKNGQNNIFVVLIFCWPSVCGVSVVTWYCNTGDTLNNIKADSEPGSPPQSIKGTLIEPWLGCKQLFGRTLVSCAVRKMILLLTITSEPHRNYHMSFVCTIQHWRAFYSFSRRVSPTFFFICFGNSVKHNVNHHN